jgi:hypothetical protein
MVDAKRVEGATVAALLIDETVRDEMVADLETMLEVVRLDMVIDGMVTFGWTTGTHCPKLWMASVAESTLSGSEMERTQ